VSKNLPEPRIRLHPLEKKHLRLRVKWFNSPSTRRSLILSCRFDYETTCRWFRGIARAADREDFVIETVSGRRPIGMIGFRKIDAANRSAGFYVVVGEPRCRGQGYGTEASIQLLERGWRTLRLHKVWCVVRTTNEASLTMLNRLGFMVEGLLRKEEFASGRWIDVVRLGILRSDFAATNPFGGSMPAATRSGSRMRRTGPQSDRVR
jgi:RimJ/RimL family protein N-acetyltransferase